jgi:hypothetical protein
VREIIDIKSGNFEFATGFAIIPLIHFVSDKSKCAISQNNTSSILDRGFDYCGTEWKLVYDEITVRSQKILLFYGLQWFH